jgi:transposase InsO family protein
VSSKRRVTRELDRIFAERGAPEAIRCDNGPEFTSRHILARAIERNIELMHIEPGRPMQNGYVESFHGKLRDECLNASWFANLFEARVKIGAWRGNTTKSGRTAVWDIWRRGSSRDALPLSGRLRLPASGNARKGTMQKS